MVQYLVKHRDNLAFPLTWRFVGRVSLLSVLVNSSFYFRWISNRTSPVTQE